MDIYEAESSEDWSEVKFSCNREAAHFWYQRGARIIPSVPAEKRPALKRVPWLSALSEETIEQHWTDHPEHDVAAVVDGTYVVFDVDGPEAKAALTALEKEHGMPPLFIVKTKRGEHHYFACPPDVCVKTDSHDSIRHPDRIDVKAKSSLIHLPPSGGRTVYHCHAKHLSDLPAVDQDFVDAVAIHNGRPVPRLPEPLELTDSDWPPVELPKLTGVLESLDPDCGYEDWTRIGMALSHETAGGSDGFALFDTWSAKGDKYPGRSVIEAKWRSFADYAGNPVTFGTLIMMAKQAGADVAVLVGGDDAFEVLGSTEEEIPSAPRPQTLLDRYSVTGQSMEIAQLMVAATAVLGFLALAGRMTVWYAASNTGKTLIMLALLVRGIQNGTVDPAKVYYVNVDDNLTGLYEKVQIAEEFGFAVLAEGFKDFKVSDLLPTLQRMADTDTAKGVVVILDTLKQFVDLMDKRQSTQFMAAVRRFVGKGGTFIGLAHTNKRPNSDGMPIFAGTTDVKEAVDCSYLIRQIDTPPGETEKFVEFIRDKDRGGGSPATASFAYSREVDISYAQLLASVREVDPDTLGAMKQAAEQLEDASIVAEIITALGEGVRTKMKLASLVNKRTRTSRADVIAILDKYTGSDPAEHHWLFEIGARGAHQFVLLDKPKTEAQDD